VKLLVCGGRDYHDATKVWSTLDLLGPSWVIHGAARGADSLAGDWAQQRKVTCTAYPADWRGYGPKAGYLRNGQMLREGRPDMVIAFPGGRGTANMVQQARAAGVPVIEVL
jgi:hypothetical protein